ncbi:MAG: PAS domain-containing protein, partial [Gaiellaceae bacterium]
MAPQFSAEAVLEAAPVAVVTVDGRGRIVHANRAAERMFGYPPASLAGRRMSEILPGARLPRLLEEPIPRTAPDRPPLPLGRRTAVSGRQADGAEFPLELTLTRSADRRPRYTAWIRKAEPPQPAPRALERSRSLLERVEEFTGAGSWHCDPERSTLEWSPNLYRLFGLQPGERRPTLEWILDHTHPDDRARVEGVLGDVLHGIRPSALEFRITPAGGGVRHLRAIAGRETVAERPTLLTGVIKDVT